jgi:hypothetical protein
LAPIVTDGIPSPLVARVEYTLTRELLRRPKTSQHLSFDRWYSTVTVHGSGQQPILEGIYDLFLEDGKTERMKNHGDQWSVLDLLP